MNAVMKDLPSTWVLVKLGEFVQSEKGKKPKNESSVKTDTHQIPYVDIQAFEENIVRTWTDGVGCRTCYESDFLMVWDGSRSGLVGNGMNGALGSTLVRINFPSMVNKYAYYFLQSKYQQINTRAKGSGTPHVDPDLVWNYNFPIPPLNEQHRIVAKIEELFSELDQSIVNLKTAQAQLKVYRQSLLKHAFEGKLTAEWRAQNADKLESADALQQRIQQARAERYQQQLVEWKAKGQQGSKPKAPRPITPLTAAELAGLPELPESWGWVQLDDFIESIDAGKSFKCDEREPTKDEIGVAKVSAVTWGEYDEAESKTCIDSSKINEAYLIQENDFIISRANTIDLVGACVIAKSVMKKVMLSDKTLRIKYTGFEQRYFLHFLRSKFGRKQIMELSTGNQDSMRNIGQERIRSIIVPICTELECTKIIEHIDNGLLKINQLDQTISISLNQAEALRQSILKKAFSGELVPQNIEDEPASILLEKIKTEKAIQQRLTSNAKSRTSKPLKDNVVPFPAKLPHIEVTELHAGLMALAYRQHEQSRRAWYFGHVKAEKISHMIEACIGIDLERMPIQDAAGPNDFKRLLAVEALARQQHWFDVKKQPNGRHLLTKLSGFDALVSRTEAALGKQLENVNALIKLFVNMDTTSSEIVATLFAAWNNLLLQGHKPNDDEIVLEARDRWHDDKLKIRKERFSRCLVWMRKHGLVPQGRGTYVAKKNQRNVPKRSI